jgi:hypothetical protein
MEAIKGKRGGYRPGAGRKKAISTSFREAIDTIDIPRIVQKLKEWTEGKEVVCPHCGENTGCSIPDTVSLQSAIELLNRRLGKVPQQVQVDVTQTIQLSADQVDLLLLRYQIAQRALPAPVIEGEVKLITS